MIKFIYTALIGWLLASGPVLTTSAAATEATQAELKRLGFHAFEQEISITDPQFDFQLESLQRGNLALSSFKGKVVFLNFWATWCPPCRSEMPSMERLYQELKSEGLEILAVDLQEDRNQVQGFVDDLGLTFPVLLDKSGRIGSRYGARSIPTTYLIDRQGKIIGGAIGAREWDTPEMIAFFRRLLEG